MRARVGWPVTVTSLGPVTFVKQRAEAIKQAKPAKKPKAARFNPNRIVSADERAAYNRTRTDGTRGRK